MSVIPSLVLAASAIVNPAWSQTNADEILESASEQSVHFQNYLEWVGIIQSFDSQVFLSSWDFADSILRDQTDEQKRILNEIYSKGRCWRYQPLSSGCLIDRWESPDDPFSIISRSIELDSHIWFGLADEELLVLTKRPLEAEPIRGDLLYLAGSPAGVRLRETWERGALAAVESSGLSKVFNLPPDSPPVQLFELEFSSNLPYPDVIRVTRGEGKVSEILAFGPPSSAASIPCPTTIVRQRYSFGEIQYSESPLVTEHYSVNISDPSYSAAAPPWRFNHLTIFDRIASSRSESVAKSASYQYLSTIREQFPSFVLLADSRGVVRSLIVLGAGIVMIFVLFLLNMPRLSRPMRNYQFLTLAPFLAVFIVSGTRSGVEGPETRNLESASSAPATLLDEVPEELLASSEVAKFVDVDLSDRTCGYWSLLALARLYEEVSSLEAWSEDGLSRHLPALSVNEIVSRLAAVNVNTSITSSLPMNLPFGPKHYLVLSRLDQPSLLHWVLVEQTEEGIKVLEPSMAKLASKSILNERALLAIVPLGSDSFRLRVEELCALVVVLTLLIILIRLRRRGVSNAQ